MKILNFTLALIMVSSSIAVEAKEAANRRSAPAKRSAMKVDPQVVFTYTSKIGQMLYAKVKHNYSGEAKMATVTFMINPDGRLTDIKLMTSSKNPALDKILIDTVTSSSPVEKAPPGITEPIKHQLGYMFSSDTKSK